MNLKVKEGYVNAGGCRVWSGSIPERPQIGSPPAESVAKPRKNNYYKLVEHSLAMRHAPVCCDWVMKCRTGEGTLLSHTPNF